MSKEAVSKYFEQYIKEEGNSFEYHPTKVYAKFAKVVDGYADQALSKYKVELTEKIEKLKKKPCEFYEDMGYHAKNCCQDQHIYNQALIDVKDIIKAENE